MWLCQMAQASKYLYALIAMLAENQVSKRYMTVF